MVVIELVALRIHQVKIVQLRAAADIKLAKAQRENGGQRWESLPFFPIITINAMHLGM